MTVHQQHGSNEKIQIRQVRFEFLSSHTVYLCCLDLQYMVDCSQVNNLPTLSFVISGVALPLPPSAYIMQASSYIHKHVFLCVFICECVRAMIDISNLLSAPPAWIPVLHSGHHSYLPAISEWPAPVDLWRRIPQRVLLHL